MIHRMNRYRSRAVLARVVFSPLVVFLGLYIVVWAALGGAFLIVMAGVMLAAGGLWLLRYGPPTGVDGEKPLEPHLVRTTLFALVLMLGGFALLSVAFMLAERGLVPWLVGPATE